MSAITQSCLIRASGPRVHPRACRENFVGRGLTGRYCGSSPHVRGKRAPRGLGLPGFRLIPACAGKTFSAQEFGPCQSAHPRVCGENWPARVSVSLAKGSSSRVRGKLTGELIHRRSAGLIPACAGKTNRIASLVSNLPAHPRVYGENGIRRGKPTSPPGSSPRVRGKGLDGLQVDAADGPIPACAGKTSASRPRTARLPAHPRMCGENDEFANIGAIPSGSSPHVRGKPSRPLGRGHSVGLIPACAGKTSA